MFSSALKSFSSNITTNYSISSQPSSSSGPWKIFDAKRKSTGKVVSVFVFDRKSLEPQAASLGGRSGAASLKHAHQQVVDRLRLEATSLARLRHPNILELVEPVEDTRNGGMMFATEQVIASLTAILEEQDLKEAASGPRRQSGRNTGHESDTTRSSTIFELDELEIQKGLLQVGKGLQFLHESAGLVHANLTPDAIIVNAKGDWKITGMAFTGPASDSDKASSSAPIHLSEVLSYDPRLPKSVQLNIDFTSPDFVLDNNLTAAADMFSLGMIILSLYNAPHQSPVDCNGSLSAYKRTFATASSVPSHNNNFLAKGKFPLNLTTDLLPKLITRRPAQRLTAKAFQEAQYFDNILVSTMRFLDALPGKSALEKTQFFRGLPRITPQFPPSVLQKKVLPALLDEMKDKDLLAGVLQNVFIVLKSVPDGKSPFIEIVIPKLRDVFLPIGSLAATTDKDASKDAGLMVIMENMEIVSDCTSGKEFRDDILPIIAVGLASATHTVVDASLATLPFITPRLDYSTIKNDLFPVIAGVFAHTNSLAIKIQGLEAFYTLCGGNEEVANGFGDGLDGVVMVQEQKKTTSSAVLDKFTVQDKIVPLLKGIKTKEPAVTMAALKVLRQVGTIADTDYVATDILPLLWSFALGPLLDLTQFQSFMSQIKSLSTRIEREHSRKLQELSKTNTVNLKSGRTPITTRSNTVNGNNSEELDFEGLVNGRKNNGTPDIINDWDGSIQMQSHSSTSRSNGTSVMPATTHKSSFTSGLRPSTNTSRSVTPDQSLSAITSLTPSTAFNRPLQPTRTISSPTTNSVPIRSPAMSNAQPPPPMSNVNWSTAMNSGINTWQSPPMLSRSPLNGNTSTSFIAPPPVSPSLGSAPNYGGRNGLGAPLQPMAGPKQVVAQQARILPQMQQPAKQGLDKYESLI